MPKIIEEKLKSMANDPNDPFTGVIRKMVGPREAVFFEDPLRRMILAMPAIIAQIKVWVSGDMSQGPLGSIHRCLLSYLDNADDIVPDKSAGLFGYVDDAYLVSAAFDRTMHETDWAGLKPYLEQPSWAREVPSWLEITRKLLPEETAKIDRMLDQWISASSNASRPPNRSPLIRRTR